MGACGVARPDRTNLIGGITANGENKIHFRGIILSKLVPALGAKIISPVSQTVEQLQGMGVHFSHRLGARGIGVEASCAFPYQNGFGENRSR